jgi:tripartite-type tricarboxylate transporter receptor subunit TctC
MLERFLFPANVKPLYCIRCRLARIYAKMERVMGRAVQSLLLALVLGPGLAAVAAGEDFYKGKTITLVVANAAGGGYDLYARLLARHMGRHIPGEPSFIVKYQPGVGGLVMANAIYAMAPRDGLTIGLMARDVGIHPSRLYFR